MKRPSASSFCRLLVFTILGFPGPAHAQPSNAVGSIALRNSPLDMVLSFYQELSGATAVIPPVGLPSRGITLAPNVSLTKDDAARLLEDALHKQAGIKTVELTNLDQVFFPKSDISTLLVVRLASANLPGPESGSRIRPNFNHAPLTNVLACYKQYAGRTLLFYPLPESQRPFPVLPLLLPSHTTISLVTSLPVPLSDAATLIELAVAANLGGRQVIHLGPHRTLLAWGSGPLSFEPCQEQFPPPEVGPADWKYRGKNIGQWMRTLFFEPTNQTPVLALIGANTNAEPELIRGLATREPTPYVSLWNHLPKWAKRYIRDPRIYAQYRLRCAMIMAYLEPFSAAGVAALIQALKDKDPRVAAAAQKSLRYLVERNGPSLADLASQFPQLQVYLQEAEAWRSHLPRPAPPGRSVR